MVKASGQFKKKRRRGESPEDDQASGFTLVEVMVGLAIFVMLIASCFACLRVGNNFVDNARHFTRASQIMQSEVERIRSMAWATLNDLPTGTTRLTLPAQFDHPVYDKYTMSRSISGTGDLRTITVEVAWTDVNGRSHTRRYLTMYTKGGLYDYIQ